MLNHVSISNVLEGGRFPNKHLNTNQSALASAGAWEEYWLKLLNLFLLSNS